ncbi:hypothetical protein [Streptomyces spectabilis]|uniref:Uncharacterized protein n=1 Tax=Streptomyces spectabilis TaxID=68270 RepID=A0A7W8EXL9_STRST|nr:hypothetical protein [Streptomyces spectabilis]MBB5109212.1 hypothetical protein [Streptomyces spectabilis]MCI3907766.1 hypothetical protein [Streptomyces spectabilis]GGV51393.1 hypothetical protein GCM10010245_81030 [Streptomyces spectabilis]
MSETTTAVQRPAVDGPKLSGVDLARVALHQAHAAARERGPRSPCSAATPGRGRAA